MKLNFSLLILLIPLFLQAQVPDNLFEELKYRNLGAFRIGAWVSDIAVPENPDQENKFTWYFAQRAGGAWKTSNNGNTFECISDDLNTSSIGCIEIAPSNPHLLWIGTGEAYSARSSYAGNGVYKSKDAGKTWEDMGLKESHHINRIIIHPTNPDIVYVASMGHLFSANEERGIFKTNNGGKSWEKILYINDKVGIIDLVINRNNPDVLFAVSYDMSRSAWHFEAGGPLSRVYKTSNAGESWDVLEGGLPTGNIGRIGIDIHRSNPDIIYTVIQNLNPDPDYVPDPNATFDEFTDNSYDALIGGQVFKSTDGGNSWKDISPDHTDVSGKAAYSFNMIYADPLNPDVAYIIGAGMNYTLDGGKTWPARRAKTKFRSNFGDNRCFWIDPTDSRHIMLGSDGGIYNSWDAGEHMHHYYHIPAGEIYHVEYDDAQPYNIYIGLQDHEAWKGPVNNWSGSIGIEDWVITGMWDGMYTQVDHENNQWLYFSTQFGKHHRENQKTGERWPISPEAAEGDPQYRYTWTTPIHISPHNSSTVYIGAQCLLRSPDRGESWEELSPDLTDNDSEKIAGKGHMMHCTITTISESKVKPGIIWIGTDDGHVHVTQNHGANWNELTSDLASVGAPVDLWVSRVTASTHSEGRAYVSKTGYRQDIFKPYVYKTEDFGASWVAINKGLPDSPISVIFEDQDNENLLYVGTDIGVYVSIDRGQSWMPLQQNIPVVPVRDLLVHPREKDLVVGTYGRGAWVMDVSFMSELNEDVLKEDLHLFDVMDKPQQNYSDRIGWGNQQMKGDNHLRTPNEPNGLEVYYYLAKDSKEDLSLSVSDYMGKEIIKKELESTKGLHKIFIDTSRMKPNPYTVSLAKGKKVITKTARVLESPTWQVGRL